VHFDLEKSILIVGRSRYEDAITRQQVTDQPRRRNHLKHRSTADRVTTRTSSTVQPDTDMLDSNPHIPNPSISKSVTPNTVFRAKTLREQQAVLGLQSLAEQDQSSEKLPGDQIADLTEKLILGAGEDVIDLVEKEEREQLELFQNLITRRLSILQGGVSGNGTGNGNGNGNSNSSVKSARSGGERVEVNGAGNGNGNGNGPGNGNGNGNRGVSPMGIAKSKSRVKAKSKSRERRGVSRGRN
jgi:hypothetical protein